MTLNVESIKPALIDMTMSLRLEKLLKFRHVFHNIYKSPLIPANLEFDNQATRDLAAMMDAVLCSSGK